MDEHKKIRENRSVEHGDPRLGFTSLAMAMTALLREHYQMDLPLLPPHMAALICTCEKTQRAARSLKYNRDDYLDARNYLDFAFEMDEEDNEKLRSERGPQSLR